MSATADFDASTADSTHQTVGPTAQQTVLEPKLGSTDGDNTPYSTAYSEHSRRKTGVFALLRWARPSGERQASLFSTAHLSPGFQLVV